MFIPGFKLYISRDYIPEVIETYRPHKGFEMITLKGYSDINEVLKYLKKDVFINKEDLKLNQDDYILEELIGCHIIENDEDYGKVTEIVYNNSNVLLQVEGAKHFYIPNNPEYIKKVDIENNKIIVENIKGLIL